jgi:hypothetical protein
VGVRNPKISYEDFDQLVKSTHESKPEWKYGQVYYNLLSYHRPDIANQIQGTLMDPFHKTQVSLHTINFVKSKW